MIAVPMFIFMASVLESSGLTDGLFKAINVWVGNIKGGIAVAVLIACTIMAAMVGVVGASVVSMTIVALPTMLKYHYNKGVALGSICAGGALGILIPPSILFVFYGIMATESIGKLFMGGVLPGLLLAGIYSLCRYPGLPSTWFLSSATSGREEYSPNSETNSY
jgi:TRAP-type mannitol/chloroaromatic compound transport system permease large subunit